MYVLVHSPLVGRLTWELVAHEMLNRGAKAIVPLLSDQPTSTMPFWKQHVESVAKALKHIPDNQNITLVAHSGAGPLLPVIRQTVNNPIDAYVFVDAGVPRDNASRLDLMKLEDLEWAVQFQQELMQGQKYPSWRDADLHDIVPNNELRRKLIAEVNPRSLSFFTEAIPVFEGWPDAPCAYIKFSTPYNSVTQQAQQAGWLVYEMEAGHFHMLLEPQAVTAMIISIVVELQRRKP